ncbi:MAG: hypothetical protein H0W50_08165 [Parachlamydiaceae bacterium]|nr:hypothetical protein [Parachlamydiaceae bacterium]
MQVNACGNQLSNLGSSFSEKSIQNNSTITNDSVVAVASIFSEFSPMDVVGEITKYADFDTLKVLLSVSKNINTVIFSQNEERSKLVKGVAFGKEEWLKFYDLDIGNEPLLSRDNIKMFNSPDPSDPTKRLIDTHLLTLIPKGVSVTSFGELAKKHFPTRRAYRDAYQPILDVVATPNEKSYWALMSKDVLNGSRNKSFETQQKMVAVLSQNANVNCEIPSALEAAVSILTHQVRSGERLFSDNPLTATRCLEVFKGFQGVGGFARLASGSTTTTMSTTSLALRPCGSSGHWSLDNWPLFEGLGFLAFGFWRTQDRLT